MSKGALPWLKLHRDFVDETTARALATSHIGSQLMIFEYTYSLARSLSGQELIKWLREPEEKAENEYFVAMML